MLERVARPDAIRDVTRAGRALRALGAFKEANAAYRDAAAEAPKRSAIQHGLGRAVPRDVPERPKRSSRSRRRSQAIRAGRRRCSARRRRSPTTIRRRRSRPPRRRSRSIPSSVDAHVFLAEQATDAGQRDEAREVAGEGARGQPVEPRGALAARGARLRRGQAADFEAEVAKVLAIAPSYGEVYRVAGELAAHNYRFDEAVALSRRALALEPQNPRDAGRARHRTCCAPATSRRARAALDASFKIDPVRQPTYNLLQMMDTLDKFVTVTRRRSRRRLDKDEAPVLQEYALPLAHQALEHAVEALRVHAEGPDPHRDLPEARRLRGAQRRPARHDRRARRLLRPRRDDGFAARRGRRASSSGRRRCGTSWRTSSRCRCRTSGCRAG